MSRFNELTFAARSKPDYFVGLAADPRGFRLHKNKAANTTSANAKYFQIAGTPPRYECHATVAT